MEDTDVEAAGTSGRISRDKVLRDVALPEALAVESYRKMLQLKCLRFSGGEDIDVVGQNQAARDLTFGIMIAVEQEDGNACLGEPTHLPYKKQAGLIVAPVSIVEVAGNDHKANFVFDRLGHEVVEGRARCRANALGGRAVLSGKALERAV